MLLIFIIGDPGAHGAAMTGMHGIGVSAPIAAAVAAATVGFAIDWHIPKGFIFTIGLLSMMFAIGCPDIFGRIGSITVSGLGAMPKLHCSIALEHTNCAIAIIWVLCLSLIL